jgi:hypothetical protein
MAALGTMLRPRKAQTFVVTPKGEKLEKRGINEIATVIPHLILFGLLIAGLTVGIRLWLQSAEPIPGLEVSLFWGAANLLLLTLAIFGAHELPQWRNNFRLPHRMPCDLICGGTSVSGVTKDMNEHGVRIELPKPVLLPSKQVTVYAESASGNALAMQGIITRQEKIGSALEVGVNFTEADQSEIARIIERMFVHPDCWADTQESAPGIWKSLWSLMTAFRAPFQSRRPARRHYPRASRKLPCTVTFDDQPYSGRTQDISFSGLAVMFDGAFTHVNGRGLLALKNISLKVAPIGVIRRGGRSIAQFRVESVEKGERQWQALNMAGWR